MIFFNKIPDPHCISYEFCTLKLLKASLSKYKFKTIKWIKNTCIILSFFISFLIVFEMYLFHHLHYVQETISQVSNMMLKLLFNCSM